MMYKVSVQKILTSEEVYQLISQYGSKVSPILPLAAEPVAAPDNQTLSINLDNYFTEKINQFLQSVKYPIKFYINSDEIEGK